MGGVHAKYLNLGDSYTQFRIANSVDEQKYLAFGSGSGSTTILCVFYVRASGIAFITSLGSKTVTITKDGDDALVSAGAWASAVIISDNNFTVTRV